MLAIERVARVALTMPLLARVGLAVLAFGGFADLVAHLGVPSGAAGPHTADQVTAHVLVFAGMVIVVLGVVADGVRLSRARRAAGVPRREWRDAVR
jgi:hypothetical protein